ncbi:MAG: MiaB/RimO family radical SAM methylthiotransferase, partial [Planctomycetota bacterium]
MAAYRISIISLGCPKNLVDSEVIAGHVAREGFEIVVEPADADVVIVNTCGFVDSAISESKETLSEICRLKAAGVIEAVLAVGCLVQRFADKLSEELPGVDAFLPITDYSDIPRMLHDILTQEEGGKVQGRGGKPRTPDTDLGRLLLTCPHVSFLRVSEGCNHRCSFCAIPSIRGKLRSKPLSVLVAEAKGLASLGVKEINLVGEDSTDYGWDWDEKPALHKLLRKLGSIRGLEWIRILYAYPTRITQALIKEIAGNPKVVNYIDMPVQHISPRILKCMRRNTAPSQIRDVIAALREQVPNIVLRTSVIVGYP